MRRSASIFSFRSRSVTRENATRSQVLDPFGRPLRLGGSAGPRSPSGIRFRGAERMPSLTGLVPLCHLMTTMETQEAEL